MAICKDCAQGNGAKFKGRHKCIVCGDGVCRLHSKTIFIRLGVTTTTVESISGKICLDCDWQELINGFKLRIANALGEGYDFGKS